MSRWDKLFFILNGINLAHLIWFDCHLPACATAPDFHVCMSDKTVSAMMMQVVTIIVGATVVPLLAWVLDVAIDWTKGVLSK